MSGKPRSHDKILVMNRTFVRHILLFSSAEGPCQYRRQPWLNTLYTSYARELRWPHPFLMLCLACSIQAFHIWGRARKLWESSLSFSYALPNHRESLDMKLCCAMLPWQNSAGLLAYRRCSQFPTSLPLNTSPSHIQRRPTADPFSSFRLVYLGCKYSDSEPLLQLSRRLNFHKRYLSSVLCLNAVLYGIRPRFSLVLLVQSLPEKFSWVLDLIYINNWANSILFISPAL